MMFQTTKRHATRHRVQSLTPLKSNKSHCPKKLSTLTIILLMLITLLIFSLYLSTQILPSNNPDIANNPINNPFWQNSNHQIPRIQSQNPSSNSDELATAIHKSLTLYINRPGHNDRVEYLIGFSANRITNPSDYQSLQPRNTQKLHMLHHLTCNKIITSTISLHIF